MGKKTQNNNKTYTYKEILLAIREQVLINEKLLNELKGLISIEKNAGTYSICEALKADLDMFTLQYRIFLEINALEEKQSKLKKILNELTNYKFSKYKPGGYHIYNFVHAGKDYNYFSLTDTHILDDDYFGKIEITDKEKFDDIIVQLYNSRLAKISEEGIHITDDSYLGIGNYIELINKDKYIYYYNQKDALKTNLNDDTFYDIMNTEVNSTLLSNELINILEGSKYKDADIQFVNNENVHHFYKFEENGKSITLK